MAKRELTDAAKAAKMIRKTLKDAGITAKVRSQNYSMGSSVNIEVTDLLPATVSEIKQYCNQFEYGSFDSMIDCYNYDNKRSDLPQAKYVSVNVTYSEELMQSAWDYLRNHLAGLESAPQDYTEGRRFYNESANKWGDELVWRILAGSNDYGFWTTRKPRIKTA